MEILLWKASVRAIPADDEFGQPKSGKIEDKVAIVLSGNARTDGKGRWTIDLKDSILGFKVFGRPSFVATPSEKEGPRPVALSAMIDGYVVTLASWELGGKVAPGVMFAWQCVVLSE
jgi:hypothetical protein